MIEAIGFMTLVAIEWLLRIVIVWLFFGTLYYIYEDFEEDRSRIERIGRIFMYVLLAPVLLIFLLFAMLAS